MNPLLTSATLWPFELVFNGVCRSDKHLGNQLSQFAGKLIEIETRKPSVTFCVQILNNGVSLKGLSSEAMDSSFDARIAADVGDLINVLTNKDAPLSNQDLEIQGNAELIHELMTLVRQFDLRWDDLLSPYLGDVATESIRNVTDQAEDFVLRANDSLRVSIDEYLKEEAQLIPTVSRMDNFGARLDDFRLRLDRAQARLALLESEAAAESE